MEGWQYHPLGMAIATPDGMTYQYNLRNRMVAYGPDQHIAYDCEEKRMGTWSDSQPDKNYVLFSASGKPLEEYSWDGIALTLERTHYYLGENLIASDVLEANKTCPTRIFVHSDHLGSPRQYSDANGQWIGYKDYYAFGNNWAEDTACLPITADYTGHQSMKNDQDPDQALIWMQARTYHPIYGRFLEPDPILISGGPNFYAYVGNNPLVRFDPLGYREALLYGEIYDVEPGDVVVLARKSDGKVDHVVVVGGFSGDEPTPHALIYENAPQEPSDAVGNFDDNFPHKPKLIDSNSSDAGGTGGWNKSQLVVKKAIANRKKNGKAFTEIEVLEAVEQVGEIYYSNAWDGLLSSQVCDCAGFVDKVVANLNKEGGRLSPTKDGSPKRLNNWLEE